MSVLKLYGREERAGSHPGWGRCVAADPGHHPVLHWCFLLALLASAAAHADFASGPPGDEGPRVWVTVEPEEPAAPPVAAEPPVSATPTVSEVPPVSATSPTPAAIPETPSMVPPRMISEDENPDLPVPVHASLPPRSAPDADHDTHPLSGIDREVVSFREGPRRPLLHLDDVATATGFVDSRVRSMALALDTPLSRNANGLTLQSRVEMAYRPGLSPVPGNWDAPPGEANATGLAVRLYGSKPTRLNGVYPFVEADWWQDNRARTININGTRIDTDVLRGLLSFNIGAHSNSTTGLKLWVKARGGKNAGGTLGARYRW
ncbi:hypothetical protein SAMN05216345_11423 [Cupriavidus sp. YR651]|nr:hypothetical protein [Cupriavidus sp. YR651]SDD71286.1 hypothetical protein SAMN05216345_11423 [Cupriavidus sp. YR651]